MPSCNPPQSCLAKPQLQIGPMLYTCIREMGIDTRHACAWRCGPTCMKRTAYIVMAYIVMAYMVMGLYRLEVRFSMHPNIRSRLEACLASPDTNVWSMPTSHACMLMHAQTTPWRAPGACLHAWSMPTCLLHACMPGPCLALMHVECMHSARLIHA